VGPLSNGYTPVQGDGSNGFGCSGNVAMWNCTTSHNEEYVRLMPELKCWEANHSVMMTFSVFWFFAYNVGLPGFLMYTLINAHVE
jgi:hypothetical protein